MTTNPKPPRIPFEPLRWAAGAPLAAELQLVARLVTEMRESGCRLYGELDLNFSEAGKQILGLDPEASARLVLALVAHADHYDKFGKRARALAKNDLERINWHHSPEWPVIWPSRQIVSGALRRVMRRKLPLGSEHLIALAQWMVSGENLNDYQYPLKAFAKAVEARGEVGQTEAALRSSLENVARLFRGSHQKDLPKLAHQIESVLGASPGAPANLTEPAQPPPQFAGPDPFLPAPAGSPSVLVQLKQFLGIAPKDEIAAEEIGFDHYPLRSDSLFRDEHELINLLLPELVERPAYHSPVLSQTTAGRAMLERDALSRGKILLAVAERCVNAHFVPGGGLGDHRCWQSQTIVNALVMILLKTVPELHRDGLFDLLLFMSALSGYPALGNAEAIGNMVSHIEQLAAASPLTDGERHVLHRLRCQSVRTCPFGHPAPEAERLSRLLGDHFFIALVPGEAWSDLVNADLGKMNQARRETWLNLFQFASTATGSRPSAKWLKTAKEILRQVGEKEFSESLRRWFPMVNATRTIRLLGGGGPTGQADTNGTIHDDNATCLRGLLWMSPEVVSTDLVRAVGALTVSCYRKIPGIGPRAVKAGNAGVYALSQINDPLAVGQLALLKVKVKFGSAQKEIEKAFNIAAERSGLPREELEEMSVPTYGLTGVGICEEPMGEFTARLTITGTTSTELVWVKADGKIQRAAPASVKESNKDDLKELQAAAKDIQKMLPAQRQRIDGLFLQQKTWALPVWRERYLNHPLIGTLARRILWEFKSGGKTVTGIWYNGRLVDLDLHPVELPDGDTTVQIWHPIGKSPEEVMAWRSWLDTQQIQQPFKQAHREIYLMTDAERNTRTYSNRYAAHVLKQHQFNALCGLRGWKNQLRLMVDAEYLPASLHLPKWGLRAEFWIEGIGADYGTDTNDSGVYLYLSTDQVRFYRVDATQRTAHASGGGYQPPHRGQDGEPLPLEEIPALVLSEVMRDVDMFVGVASVGNDPAWADGGPEGRHQQYWRGYSFGELNASAKTRKEVLERLVPKLKVAGRCAFVDKFLVVKGSLRTYKIHLGSGNILMEPNDQYLCIVPRQGDAEEGGVLLPFEGDRTLSIILSKAFLLAEDAKIKDETILRQIKG